MSLSSLSAPLPLYFSLPLCRTVSLLNSASLCLSLRCRAQRPPWQRPLGAAASEQQGERPREIDASAETAAGAGGVRGPERDGGREYVDRRARGEGAAGGGEGRQPGGEQRVRWLGAVADAHRARGYG